MGKTESQLRKDEAALAIRRLFEASPADASCYRHGYLQRQDLAVGVGRSLWRCTHGPSVFQVAVLAGHHGRSVVRCAGGEEGIGGCGTLTVRHRGDSELRQCCMPRSEQVSAPAAYGDAAWAGERGRRAEGGRR
jgi:hypothetical protein